MPRARNAVLKAAIDQVLRKINAARPSGNNASSPTRKVSNSGHKASEVTEIAKHQIQEQLQTLPGVGAVFMSGGRTRAIQVIVNPDSLASYKLSIEDVRTALVTQNLETPGGIVQQPEVRENGHDDVALGDLRGSCCF